MPDETTEKVTTEETTTVEKPDTVTKEETTVEKPVLNDPSDLARMPPGAPQAVEKTTTVTETDESSE